MEFLYEVFRLAVIISIFLFHEFGHYLVAKRRRVYKGWGFLPTLHIKLKSIFPSRWDYLSGIVGSYIALPLYLVFVFNEFSVFEGILWFTLMAFIAGIIDVFCFLGYDRIKRAFLPASSNVF